MKDKILSKIKNYLLRFLQVQLVISLALIVILPSWGLPISILSPIGNIAFTPIFMAFLILSSILFFSELLCIPNTFLVYLLKTLSNIWFFLIPDLYNKFLIGFTKPPLLFLIIVPIATLAILINKKINTIIKSICALTILFILSCAYLKIIHAPKQIIKKIKCNNGTVTFIYDHGKSALIDPGVIGKRLSAPSWIQYTLIPEIIKSSGCTNINHLIILQPGKITFDAIIQLCKTIKIKTIHLIVFDGKMKYSTVSSFFKLKKIAKKRNIKLYRIGRKESIINLSENTQITITPLEKKLKYNKLTLPAIRLKYTNPTIKIKKHNKNMTIYSTKYKKPRK